MPTTAAQSYSAQALVPAIADRHAPEINVALKPGTYAQGTLLNPDPNQVGREVSVTDGDDGDPTKAHLVLKYACVVASDGTITFGTAGAGEYGQQAKTAPAYLGGIFRSVDLVGFDTDSRAALGARVIDRGVDQLVVIPS